MGSTSWRRVADLGIHTNERPLLSCRIMQQPQTSPLRSHSFIASTIFSRKYEATSCERSNSIKAASVAPGSGDFSKMLMNWCNSLFCQRPFRPSSPALGKSIPSNLVSNWFLSLFVGKSASTRPAILSVSSAPDTSCGSANPRFKYHPRNDTSHDP